MVGGAAALKVELAQLAGDDLGALESDWRALEERADDVTPYLSFDWLSAWSRVYDGGPLLLARLTETGGTVAGLGVIEQGPHGRWRFAGAPVSTHRGLLCARGTEQEAWQALAATLESEASGWATLEAEGVGAAAAAFRLARLEPVTVPALALPGSFEAYLEERPSSTRKRLRQRLRYLERAGGRVVDASDPGLGLGDFVVLHNERARRKGERHPQIDDRLARLLEALATATRLRLHVSQLVVEERLLGVAIHVDYGDTVYFYNGGIREAGTQLSPGILLELDAIRAAIQRGLRRFDLGPGEYHYKTELGGVPTVRFRLTASAPTVRGRVTGVGLSAARRARLLVGRQRLQSLFRAPGGGRKR